MELADHIRKISFIFFIILGLAHFVAGFCFASGYAVNISLIVNRALFIPFIVSTLTYFSANTVWHKLQEGKSARTLTYVLTAICIMVLIGLIALEVFVPDASHILIPA